VVEVEVGWRVLEFEWLIRECRGECALPGAVKLEPRTVAGGRCVVELEVGRRVPEFE
jgi:hypothetical protein